MATFQVYSLLMAVHVVASVMAIGSITSVGTYTATDVEVDLPKDKTYLRLTIAASYSATAHRLLILQDKTKAIACIAAARGWLRGCSDDTPERSLAQRCTLAGTLAAIQLAGLVKPFDPPASCCAAIEALGLAQGNPMLWAEVGRTGLEPMGFLDGDCPGLSEVFAAGSKSRNGQLAKLLECTPLGLATNTEGQLNTFYLSQGELFRSRHPDLPYENAAGATSSLQDLVLRPVRRFSPKQWDYGNRRKGNDAASARDNGDFALLSLIDPRITKHLASRNVTLGFTEMFHSCAPALENSFAESAVTVANLINNSPDTTAGPRLVCAWRRHPELFSMDAAVFMSDSFQWHHPLSEGGGGDSVVAGARLVATGEDPRLFEFRGRFYFSMQRKSHGESGVVYSKTASEAVFRNFLVDAATGRTVQLRLPPEGWAGATPPLPAQIKGSTFVPDGKNWIPCIYQDQLLFFFTLMPLRVLRCDHLTGQCQWWLPQNFQKSSPHGEPEEVTPTGDPEGKDIGALRGGSAAVIISNMAWRSDVRRYAGDTQETMAEQGNARSGGHVAVGFGHATLSSAQHSAFLYAVDMRTLEIRLAFQHPDELATPFSGFSYMDPTSFWQEIDSVALPTGEHTLVTRTYVACTLRVAPDYLSFDPSHHQTVVFEATSDLLRLSDRHVHEKQCPNEPVHPSSQPNFQNPKNTETPAALVDESDVWM